MRSLRTQLLILVCGTVFSVFALLAGMVMINYRGLVETSAEREMVLIAETYSDVLNTSFGAVERAAANIKEYIEHEVDPVKLSKDTVYADLFYSDLVIRCGKSAKIAGCVNSVYFRPDPTIYGAKEGVFLVDNGYGDYMREDNIDILAYDSKDREHVGWYYEPVEAGRALWMDPYYNKSINAYLISYVIPVYANDRLLGVYGMDISMATILKVINSIDFGQGFGFLADDEGNLVYHKDYPEGLIEILLDEEIGAAVDFLISKRSRDNSIGSYKYKGKNWSIIGADLLNDMKLAITVPWSQVRGPINRMWRNMTLLLLVVVAIVFFAGWFVMTRIVGPIQELTKAASRISKGELNTPIEYSSKNELGELSKSIKQMARELGEYFSYIRAQAYVDAMTGVGNKAAYIDAIRLLDRKVKEKIADFSVVVFDINRLKWVNDNLGHEFGDMIISDAASIMKLVFGADHIYRVGGDEFTVLLEGVTESDMDLYFSKFDERLLEFNSGFRQSLAKLGISHGYALFRQEYDDV